MRNAFIDELTKQARVHSHIALIVGDLGFSVVEPFAEEFPDRFLNAGVAEQNMTGIAAGMASEGYHVFTYSIANFPTFRCAEQIRNDVDYHELPVTAVAVGAGVAYGNLGYSHHALQDYALMRCMPNMLIASPGDPMEVRGCLNYLIENPQPSYLRLGKAGEPNFHSDIPKIIPGDWVYLRHPQNNCNELLLSTGAALQLIIEWGETPEFREFGIATLPMWGMKQKRIQAGQFAKFNKVITFEDHLIDGGFGSWMMESIRQDSTLLSKIKSFAISSKVCGLVAKSETIWKNYISD